MVRAVPRQLRLLGQQWQPLATNAAVGRTRPAPSSVVDPADGAQVGFPPPYTTPARCADRKLRSQLDAGAAADGRGPPQVTQARASARPVQHV